MAETSCSCKMLLLRRCRQMQLAVTDITIKLSNHDRFERRCPRPLPQLTGAASFAHLRIIQLAHVCMIMNEVNIFVL